MVSPAAKVNVPLPAVKSSGATAALSCVVQSTVIASSAAALSVIVNTASTVPELPSVIVTSSIVKFGRGASSSSIVTNPWLSEIVAPPVALVRLTVKDSLPSSSSSPLTVRDTVLLLSPGAKVIVPLAAT
ncbi:hypothetical protein D3C72_1254250 [compost metagenome]